MIIIISVSLFILVCLVVVIRLAIVRSQMNKQAVLDLAKKREQEYREKRVGETETAKVVTAQALMATATAEKMLEMQDQSVALRVVTRKKKQAEEEKYEDQYDPNVEFAVFEVGDKTKGGLQSLKEKMNLADGLGEGDSSDSDS